MSILSIRLGHDSSLAFVRDREVCVIELERVMGVRHFDWRKREADATAEGLREFCWEHYGMDRFNRALNIDGLEGAGRIARAFGVVERPEPVAHHLAHAAAAFYASDWEQAQIFSYDGGGGDGYLRHFLGDRARGMRYADEFSPLPQFSLGLGFRNFGYAISEIRKSGTAATYRGYGLEFAGKLMGLAAYGEPIAKAIPEFIAYFHTLRMQMPFEERVQRLRMLGERIGIPLMFNSLSGDVSAAIAATAQAAFEQVMFDVILPRVRDSRLPVILTGGCALNVIFNEKLARRLDVPVWVPPNPNDCGLALGGLLLKLKPEHKVDVTYAGVPILDRFELGRQVESWPARRVTVKEVAELLHQGKILAVMQGNSEHGPRALGNRSILCHPGLPGMKERLNSGVKFREAFRPFAPVVRQEEAARYFDCGSYDMSFMSFNPKVRPEWAASLAAAVHVDGSARVQTVTQKNHPWLYALLGAFEERAGFGVLLNTSFNSRGKPMVTTIKEALRCLVETDLDGCVIEDYLFAKERTPV